MSKEIVMSAEALANMPDGWQDVFSPAATEGDLTSGVGPSFNALSIKGSRFAIKSGDETGLIANEHGEPVTSLAVVILKSNPHISKVWYDKGYIEGDTASPDCFSNNGDVPDPTSLLPQSATCALCPKGAYGSAITAEGKKSFACANSRRLAVHILTPLPNGFDQEAPVLLRIPGASLSGLANYGSLMQSKQLPYNRVVSKISFDPNSSYPKINWKALRLIKEDEMPLVAKLIMDDQTNAIIGKTPPTVVTDDIAFSEDPIVSPDESPAPAPKAAIRKAAIRKAATRKAPIPVVAPVAKPPSDEDNALNEIISELELGV